MSTAAVLGPVGMTSAESAVLARILRDHAHLCQRLAASHEANRDRARELAQDILVAVWRAWPAFRGQCSERTYVARIAQYRIATHVSRAMREPPVEPLSEDLIDATPTPEAMVIRDDERERLTNLVRELPIALREVAVLLLEGFTPSEIADTLGITANAVSIRATRARDFLRIRLEKVR
jgi:RNA polymerase sigma-70 factor (ECF subfamily)